MPPGQALPVSVLFGLLYGVGAFFIIWTFFKICKSIKKNVASAVARVPLYFVVFLVCCIAWAVFQAAFKGTQRQVITSNESLPIKTASPSPKKTVYSTIPDPKKERVVPRVDKDGRLILDQAVIDKPKKQDPTKKTVVYSPQPASETAPPENRQPVKLPLRPDPDVLLNDLVTFD